MCAFLTKSRAKVFRRSAGSHDPSSATESTPSWHEMKSILLTLANDITITRLILAWVGLALMASDCWSMAFLLLLVAVMLDSVDGAVARKLDQVSRQGIFLDVMADKILII
ncbi:hypothetical protein CKO27_06255 [Thiocystis violacea]|nr:hypothetical protein [Thiocystis violacea]